MKIIQDCNMWVIVRPARRPKGAYYLEYTTYVGETRSRVIIRFLEDTFDSAISWAQARRYGFRCVKVNVVEASNVNG